MASARRLSDIYRPGVGFIGAREQSEERVHGEAISGKQLSSKLSSMTTDKHTALGLMYHHPDMPPSQETFTAAPHSYYAVEPQISATVAVHVGPTHGLQVSQPTSASTPSAKRHALLAVSSPNKKRKLGMNNADRKSRMKGKKGEDEGFIPNWERMTPYSISTLRNKISGTKIIKYLKEQGVDVAEEFPKMNMIYNGENMTRGIAMAKKAQELHQANIDQKLAEGQVPSISDSPSWVSLRNVPPTPNNHAVVLWSDGDESATTHPQTATRPSPTLKERKNQTIPDDKPRKARLPINNGARVPSVEIMCYRRPEDQHQRGS